MDSCIKDLCTIIGNSSLSEQDIENGNSLSVSYRDLTRKEFLNNGYPDDSLSSVRMDGAEKRTGRKYSMGIVADGPDGSYLKIETIPRRILTSPGKGENRDRAENALEFLARSVRDTLTGGEFSIHPFYGAVSGTDNSPISPGFCAPHSREVPLSMTILLTDLGEDPAKNPNQEHRAQAIAKSLEDKWDLESLKFNRISDEIETERAYGVDIPATMYVGCQDVINFMDALKQCKGELAFRNLNITRTTYKDLSLPQIEESLKNSSLPRKKLIDVYATYDAG